MWSCLLRILDALDQCFRHLAANFRDVKICFVPAGHLFIAYLVKVMSYCIFLALEQSLYLPIAFGFSEPADSAGLLKCKEEATWCWLYNFNSLLPSSLPPSLPPTPWQINFCFPCTVSKLEWALKSSLVRLQVRMLRRGGWHPPLMEQPGEKVPSSPTGFLGEKVLESVLSHQPENFRWAPCLILQKHQAKTSPPPSKSAPHERPNSREQRFNINNMRYEHGKLKRKNIYREFNLESKT